MLKAGIMVVSGDTALHTFKGVCVGIIFKCVSEVN